MPFLTINGITVPTAKGGQTEIQEIGNRQRAFDGTYIRDTRAFKRRWKFATKPIAELRAMSLIGLIQGKGFYCPFNGDNYATNGFTPTGSIIQRSAVAADGAAVYDENGVLEAKYGTYSVCGEAAATTPNKVTTGHAECSTTVGFGAIGTPAATLSVDTAQKLQGSNSLKVVSTVNFGGFDASGFTGPYTIGLPYTLSAYVYAATAVPVLLVLYDNTSANFTSTPVTLTAGAWRRISATCTSMGLIDWHMQLVTNGAGGTFWCDKIQLELSAWPTSWLTPASSRVNTDLYYTTGSHVSSEGMTVNFWMTKPYNTGVETAFWATGGAASTYHAIFAPAGAPNTLAVDTAVAGLVYNRISASITYTGWHMVTYVSRYNAETNEYGKYLYVDGTLRAQTTLSNASMSSDLTSWSPGQAFNAQWSYNRLSDVQVLPFAVDSTWVTGTYNAGSSPGSTPFLKAAGDFIPDTSLTVMGQIERVNTVSYYDSTNSVWRANGRTVEFTLEEV
jgi:hypothetical protein